MHCALLRSVALRYKWSARLLSHRPALGCIEMRVDMFRGCLVMSQGQRVSHGSQSVPPGVSLSSPLALIRECITCTAQLDWAALRLIGCKWADCHLAQSVPFSTRQPLCVSDGWCSLMHSFLSSLICIYWLLHSAAAIRCLSLTL